MNFVYSIHENKQLKFDTFSYYSLNNLKDSQTIKIIYKICDTKQK